MISIEGEEEEKETGSNEWGGRKGDRARGERESEREREQSLSGTLTFSE